MNNKTKNRIILFGQQNLQNSMLVGYLNQNTESECQLESQPTWKCAWNADTRPLLILIDANLARIEQISNLLEQIYEQALRSEEHTSELQSRPHLVCRLLLEKK